jgi:hypothetical protein
MSLEAATNYLEMNLAASHHWKLISFSKKKHRLWFTVAARHAGRQKKKKTQKTPVELRGHFQTSSKIQYDSSVVGTWGGGGGKRRTCKNFIFFFLNVAVK